MLPSSLKKPTALTNAKRAATGAFWQALNVRWLVVSLPATNLTGRFDLADRQRKLVHETLTGLDWPVTELLVGNELIFCIGKRMAEAKNRADSSDRIGRYRELAIRSQKLLHWKTAIQKSAPNSRAFQPIENRSAAYGGGISERTELDTCSRSHSAGMDSRT